MTEIETLVADFPDYDAEMLNDYGGGDVSWWQDYLRAEIQRANEHWRAALAARPKVKALDDTDYREIHALARDAKRLFSRGYAPCDIPIQDDFGWWVMKETERRILAALEDGQ
jgi:hypothetical protein